MITTNDIQSIVIGSSCRESWPCGHDSTVTLNDGRSSSGLSSYEIWAIISNLANEKINPNGDWSANKVKEHFQEYSQPSGSWEVKSADDVLNRLFAKKVAPSFDLQQMMTKAHQFSGSNTQLFTFIIAILQSDEFKDNPKAYLDKWREERGHTEECRIPEDRARRFFDQNFKFDEICQLKKNYENDPRAFLF